MSPAAANTQWAKSWGFSPITWLSGFSRKVNCGGLAIHPSFRGRRVADQAARLFQRYLIFELDFHRLELACYGFNERAIRHSERVGFVREGVKRRAYLKDGEGVDAVLFSLLDDELDE